ILRAARKRPELGGGVSPVFGADFRAAQCPKSELYRAERNSGGQAIRYEVTSKPRHAPSITTKVAHPSSRIGRELTQGPITLGSFVSRITSRISGGASKPLMTAA